GPVLECRSEYRFVRLSKDAARLLVVPEHEWLSLKAFPADGRRVVTEKRIVGGGTANYVFDFLPALLESLRRQHTHAHVVGARGGHRARPVAASDLADIEVHRVMVIAEVRVARLLLIPLLLEL